MAFSSGRVLSCLSTGTDAWYEKLGIRDSGDVNFDSFGVAPWDAIGMHGDRCQLHEAIQTMMLRWLMRLLTDQ